jgi:hypothetical protein
VLYLVCLSLSFQIETDPIIKMMHKTCSGQESHTNNDIYIYIPVVGVVVVAATDVDVDVVDVVDVVVVVNHTRMHIMYIIYIYIYIMIKCPVIRSNVYPFWMLFRIKQHDEDDIRAPYSKVNINH